jgi:Rrf2 family transcriptional regulator, nitric oxide-sensitive transcriptional repressor
VQVQSTTGEAALRLTSFTDYGLRTLMRLAGDPGRSFTTGEIASEFAISRHHLTKVVLALGRAGFIATQRGAGGGFRLARDPAALTLGTVVRALEEGQALVECFRADGGDCVLTAGLRAQAAACPRARGVPRRARSHDAGRLPLPAAGAGGLSDCSGPLYRGAGR